MGWLFMDNLGGHTTPRAYLDDQFTHAGPERRQRVIASAVVGMRTYYAAIESIAPEGNREVFAAVCLIKYNPRAADGYIFGYKDMTEHSGPNESACPQAILDLLTPIEHDYALAWRARCHANIAARKSLAAKPTPRPGQTIVFDVAIRLSNGRSVCRFEVVADPRGRKAPLYRDVETRALCRLLNVKQLSYHLISPAIIPASN